MKGIGSTWITERIGLYSVGLRWIGTCLVVVFIVLLWIELEHALTRADLDGIGLSWVEFG